MTAPNIRFYTHHVQPDGNLVASFRLDIPGPLWWQTCRGDIIVSKYDGKEIVVWPKKGEHYATTPSSPEERAKADAWIMEHFKKWRVGR